MNLTIKQILQKGISAHKDGKIQEAERLYRIILKAQPSHPDANHNLGVLAVSVNKTDVALPLFKTALEANPEIEQFWLSYINALIKEEQFEKAIAVVEEGKSKGVNKEKIKSLERMIVSLTQSIITDSEYPSQQQLNILLEFYQAGQYKDAEKLALSITQEFPEHPYGWKILGALFIQTDRKSEALSANKKVVALSPQDSKAHFNLGIALKDLGRLDDALESYHNAIELEPDFTGAYNNLGIALFELGRLSEAESINKQAIALKPDFAELHCNLGNTLKELGRYNEALASYRQAIELKPDFVEACYNLGIILFEDKQYNLAAEKFELIDFKQSKLFLIRCSFLNDEKAIFFDKFDSLINHGEVNAVLGSLGFCSEIKYGIKKLNPFCNDPLKYVVKTNLNTLYDFENIFIKTTEDILKDDSVSFKTQGHLTNGVQTAGNIFLQGKLPKTEIENIIHAEIEKYRTHFKNINEGFIKNWPSSYEISGWLVRMKSGGTLAPHMHDTGWLTGSIYINVPPKSKINSGNLVLCLSDQGGDLEAEKNQQSIIDVVSGDLCLFPSSLHHYTVPFEEKEDRIVLAFDVIPKS